MNLITDDYVTHEYITQEGDVFTCTTADGKYICTIRILELSENETTWAIEGGPGVGVIIDGVVRELDGTPSCAGLPRIWQMFAFILGRKVKTEVFNPIFNEFLEDYTYAQSLCTNRIERNWLRVAFSARTLAMICRCYKLQVWGPIAIALKFVWDRFFNLQ